MMYRDGSHYPTFYPRLYRDYDIRRDDVRTVLMTAAEEIDKIVTKLKKAERKRKDINSKNGRGDDRSKSSSSSGSSSNRNSSCNRNKSNASYYGSMRYITGETRDPYEIYKKYGRDGHEPDYDESFLKVWGHFNSEKDRNQNKLFKWLINNNSIDLSDAISALHQFYKLFYYQVLRNHRKLDDIVLIIWQVFYYLSDIKYALSPSFHLIKTARDLLLHIIYSLPPKQVTIRELVLYAMVCMAQATNRDNIGSISVEPKSSNSDAPASSRRSFIKLSQYFAEMRTLRDALRYLHLYRHRDWAFIMPCFYYQRIFNQNEYDIYINRCRIGTKEYHGMRDCLGGMYSIRLKAVQRIFLNDIFKGLRVENIWEKYLGIISCYRVGLREGEVPPRVLKISEKIKLMRRGLSDILLLLVDNEDSDDDCSSGNSNSSNSSSNNNNMNNSSNHIGRSKIPDAKRMWVVRKCGMRIEVLEGRPRPRDTTVGSTLSSPL